MALKPSLSDEDWLERTLSKLHTTPKEASKPQLHASLEGWIQRVKSDQEERRRTKSEVRLETAPMPEETSNWTSNVLSSLHSGSGLRRSASQVNNGKDGIIKKVTLQEEAEDCAEESKKASMEQLQNLLPDYELVLERLRGGGGGFSESEMARIKSTFMRFRVPDSMDVHKDDIMTILQHLGYQNVKKEKIKEYADEITEYSTLELADFLRLVERHAKEERDEFKRQFDAFDDDGNGTLDRQELHNYLESMGYTVLRNMINEAISYVDLDGNGCLDFEETGLLMALYRNSEGFTRTEIEELYLKFNDQEHAVEQGESCLPADKLREVLTKFFGPSAHNTSKEIEQELRALGGHHDEGGKANAPQGLNFSEVMLWARRLRDKDFHNYREAFNKFDVDGSGTIDMDELREVIQTLGYTLLPEVIREAVEEAKLRGGPVGEEEEAVAKDELDFDEFVHLMEIFRETDGFSRAEIEEIHKAFAQFDEDGSGDIDTVELADMLHSMGHSLKLDDAHRLIAMGDCNDDGTLDRREFQVLMRHRREEELVGVKEVFMECANKDGVIKAGAVDMAWKMLNQESLDDDGDATDIQIYDGKEDVDLDAFIRAVDAGRKKMVEQRKKRAGFSKGELARFERLFNELDMRKEGLLECTEVQKLVVTLGFEMRTVDEQEEFRKQYDASRMEVMGKDKGKVNFWVVVHILRAYYKRDDRRSLGRVTKAAQTARFTVSEVNQFREVFSSWWEKDRVFEPQYEEGLEPEEDKKELTTQSLRRLLKSMGLTLTAAERTGLDKKVEELDENSAVDFANFLLVMRWMLDSNLGGISSAHKK